MRLRVLGLTFACLAIAPSAEADTLWFGPQLALPLSAGDIGNTQLGASAGVTLNDMKSAHVGVGMDLVYHYWPASPEYKAAFDRYLRRARYQVIDGPTWAFTALQATGHVKVLAPAIGKHVPWAQIGLGVYRVNYNLADPNWEGSVVRLVGPGPSNVTIVPGWNASAGFDFRARPNLVIGFDANYHRLWSDSEFQASRFVMPDFSAFTVGTHIQVGW